MWDEVKAKDSAKSRALLERSDFVGANITDSYGYTALHWAAYMSLADVPAWPRERDEVQR